MCKLTYEDILGRRTILKICPKKKVLIYIIQYIINNVYNIFYLRHIVFGIQVKIGTKIKN